MNLRIQAACSVALLSLAVARSSPGESTSQPDPATRLVTRTGDQSVVLHWDAPLNSSVLGFHVLRSTNPQGPFSYQTTNHLQLRSFADLNVTNGQAYYYLVRAANVAGESPDSTVVSATPRPFASDEAFLELLQATAFDFFWYEANPTNGLIKDRSTPNSFCSIAATGFGLTAIGIGIDHGWISREEGRTRVLCALRTFWETPQNANASGTIGYKGWFYHFLDMRTAKRYSGVELSSIDTALLLSGILYARQFFAGDHPDEVSIRSLADSIYGRIDWSWMTAGGRTLSHGWMPGQGFLTSRWTGYNEAMILYILGLGAPTNPLPVAHWTNWTATYKWQSFYGYSFVNFPPLFGHQYSHCWIDFRYLADDYMGKKGITYFENSRRATLAQREYAIQNPLARLGYGSNLWGLTACDGPGFSGYLGYSARGAPPSFNDDGTIAPTAAGGSLAFTPELSLAALRWMYDNYRKSLWTGYGFRDAFNLRAQWWDPDALGIDQGPILLMAENYRSKRVWNVFMKSPEIQRGLQRAGFRSVGFARPRVEPKPDGHAVRLSWDAPSPGLFQVESSTNLGNWQPSQTGFLAATNAPGTVEWTDSGPPSTPAPPFAVPHRFYRVVEMSHVDN